MDNFIYMTILLYALGWFTLHTILTLWAFIVIMKWKAQGMTSQSASYFQKLVFSTGLILDASYNYSLLGGALVLLQFPRRGEVLFTAHLKRVMKANLTKTRMQRYRTIVCKVYCYTLDFWDVGHCR